MQDMQAPLRERKRRATRRALEQAALHSFLEKGYARTTIDEIADRANVSRSTFFRYFGSKEAVLFAPEEESGNRFVEFLRARPDDEGPLHAFERALIALAREEPQLPRELALARNRLFTSDPSLMARRTEHLSRWIELLAQALAEREGATSPEPRHRLASWVGVAVVQELSTEWRSAVEEPDTPQLIRDRFELLRGLAT